MQRWNAGAVFLKDVAKPKTNEPHRAQVQTDLARYMVQGVDAVEKGVSLSDSYNDMGPLQKQLMVGMSKFVLPVSKGANTQARFAESLFFEGGSRHRRGCHVDIPRRRVAAPPRLDIPRATERAERTKIDGHYANPSEPPDDPRGSHGVARSPRLPHGSSESADGFALRSMRRADEDWELETSTNSRTASMIVARGDSATAAAWIVRGRGRLRVAGKRSSRPRRSRDPRP